MVGMGRDITKYLQRLLRQKGFSFTTSAEREIVRDIKEKLCYVVLDPEKEIMLAKKVAGMEKTYMLPDGETITVGVERFLAPECFFNPGVIGIKARMKLVVDFWTFSFLIYGIANRSI